MSLYIYTNISRNENLMRNDFLIYLFIPVIFFLKLVLVHTFSTIFQTMILYIYCILIISNSKQDKNGRL